MTISLDRQEQAANVAIGTNHPRIILFCVYFSALFLTVYFLPGLLRKDIFTNDMAEWTSWFYIYQDKELFPNDLNKIYWIANFPPGYFFTLRLLSPYIDPKILGDCLGFFLGVILTLLAYRIGREVTGGKTWGGIAVTVLIVLSQFSPLLLANFLNREVGGLPRAFALPIILFGVLSVLRQNYRTMGLAFVFGALFYPPVCVILGTYLIAVLTFNFVKGRPTAKGLPLLAILATGAAAIVVTSAINSRATTGPLYSLHQMLSMSEFWRGGGWVFFFENWWDYLLGALKLDDGPLGMIWFLFIILTFTWGWIKNDRRLLRPEIVLIPASAIVNYVAAYLLMLRLFEPSRYLLFAYQALTICCFPFFLEYIVYSLVPGLAGVTLSNRAPRSLWRVGFVLVTVIGIAAFSARVAFNRGGVGDTMPSKLYEFLQTLPKDALIASTPTDGDRVPMRSRRSVLLMNGSIFPYHPIYYEKMKERFLAVLAAMYSSGPEQAIDLRKNFGARYLIVHKDLAKNDPISGLKPFKEYLSISLAKLGKHPSFILANATSLAVFQEGNYSVLDLDRVEPLHEPSSSGH
jgi:hypothetical protein